MAIILGMAGTGKTRKATNLIKNKKKVLFLATTAAVVRQAPKSATLKMTVAAFVTRQLKLHSDYTIYIDEVSMIEQKTMNTVLKQAQNNDIIMTGDPYQIPPITTQEVNKWWFYAEEYIKREKTTQILTKQHRLEGESCKDIRNVLEEMGNANPNWKNSLIDYIEKNRKKTTPQNSHIIVFTNKKLNQITRNWAKKNNIVLNEHGLAENMPVTVTTNKKHPTIKYDYEYRNGQKGTIVNFKKQYTTFKDDETGSIIKIENKGQAKTIPQLKSAIAETADSAQGKTITKDVNVVFDDHYLPDPAHFIVAATRSKKTTFTFKSMTQIENHIRAKEFKFDTDIIQYINSVQ